MNKVIFFLAILLCSLSAVGQCSPNVFDAEFVSNNDGDTFVAIIKIPSNKKYFEFEEQKISVRLHNCDTFENSKKGKRHQTPNQNMLADKAKLRLTQMLQGQKITLHLLYKDGYGKRWVSDVYVNDRKPRVGLILKQEGLTTGKYENHPAKKAKIIKIKK